MPRKNPVHNERFFLGILDNMRLVNEMWCINHAQAFIEPRGVEVAILQGLQGWLGYADAHLERFEELIGNDGVLGPAWADWGEAIRALLNGDIGRFDAGTLDRQITEALHTAELPSSTDY